MNQNNDNYTMQSKLQYEQNNELERCTTKDEPKPMNSQLTNHKHITWKSWKGNKYETSKDEITPKEEVCNFWARGETTHQVPQGDGAQLDSSLLLNRKPLQPRMNLKVKCSTWIVKASELKPWA